MEVTFSHITKIYRQKKTETTALNDVNFTVPDGHLIGLLGPSGCGKSTTLNILCGLEAPTEGKIFFGDKDVTELAPEKRGVGMVFQNYALYPHMTVRKNILFPLENAGQLSKAEREERVLKTARLVQLEDLLDRKPNELSGGQQQRVAIARALVKEPDLLLMDEPLSNLDARLRLQTREEIRRVQTATKVTTVFVTHDQEEAMSICDQIVVMKEGCVQQIGMPQQVYDDPENLFVASFLGTPPVNVFNGEIKNGHLYIGEDDIKAVNLPDQKVIAAIRPENFIPDSQGVLKVNVQRTEVMGRDHSIVFTHPAASQICRAIVPADSAKPAFNIKKLLLFDAATQNRIKEDVS